MMEIFAVVMCVTRIWTSDGHTTRHCVLQDARHLVFNSSEQCEAALSRTGLKGWTENWSWAAGTVDFKCMSKTIPVWQPVEK